MTKKELLFDGSKHRAVVAMLGWAKTVLMAGKERGRYCNPVLTNFSALEYLHQVSLALLHVKVISRQAVMGWYA